MTPNNTRNSALQAAIALFREPTRVKQKRAAPLPNDISFLLRLVSRDEQAIEEAVQTSQRSADFVVSAAEFYVEQVLFAPQADSYRALGGGPETARETLRWHMVMLLKWLHPDAGLDEARAMLAVRVTKAWNNLKTQERRDVYDADRPEVAARALLREAASVRKAYVPHYRPKVGPKPRSRRPNLFGSETDGIAPAGVPMPLPATNKSSGLFGILLSLFHIKLKRV